MIEVMNGDKDPHIKEGWHGERKIPHADRADVLRPSLPG